MHSLTLKSFLMKSGLAVLLVFVSVSLASASIEAQRLRLLYTSEGSVEAALLLPPTAVAADVVSELDFFDERKPYSALISSATIDILNPALGEYVSVGQSSVAFSRYNRFESFLAARHRDYSAWLSMNRDPRGSAYTVDLSSDSVTLVGLIGVSGDNYILQGLTVIPEPSAATLIVGFVALLGLRRLRFVGGDER